MSKETYLVCDICGSYGFKKFKKAPTKPEPLVTTCSGCDEEFGMDLMETEEERFNFAMKLLSKKK